MFFFPAFVGPAVCLLGVTLLGCNFKASLALFALSMAFNGFSYPGYCVTHVDMTPDFAGKNIYKVIFTSKLWDILLI